jgi:gluconate kinase
LCDLQRKYKEIAMKRYKPRAVEVVIQCIKLKREIREGLKPESENKIIIEFEGAPRKSNEVIYED